MAFVDGAGARCDVVSAADMESESGSGEVAMVEGQVRALRKEREDSAATMTWVARLDPLLK